MPIECVDDDGHRIDYRVVAQNVARTARMVDALVAYDTAIRTVNFNSLLQPWYNTAVAHDAHANARGAIPRMMIVTPVNRKLKKLGRKRPLPLEERAPVVESSRQARDRGRTAFLGETMQRRPPNQRVYSAHKNHGNGQYPGRKNKGHR